MNEHIELLKKEIDTLELNLERAKKKPGVKTEELESIEKKIRLKTEILGVLIAVCTMEK